MKRKTAEIDIRVEPQLVERIDVWRARQQPTSSRAAAIVYMLGRFLGTINVDSRVGEFTEFTLQLLRTRQTTMEEAAS